MIVWLRKLFLCLTVGLGTFTLAAVVTIVVSEIMSPTDVLRPHEEMQPSVVSGSEPTDDERWLELANKHPLSTKYEQADYLQKFLNGRLHDALSVEGKFDGPVFFYKSFVRDDAAYCDAVFSALKNGESEFVEPAIVTPDLQTMKQKVGLDHCSAPNFEGNGYAVGYERISHDESIKRQKSVFGQITAINSKARHAAPSVLEMRSNVAFYPMPESQKGVALISADEFCRRPQQRNSGIMAYGGQLACAQPVYMEVEGTNCHVERVIERASNSRTPVYGTITRGEKVRGDAKSLLPAFASGVFVYDHVPNYFNLGYAHDKLMGRVITLRTGRLFDTGNPKAVPDCEFTTFLTSKEAEEKHDFYVDVFTGDGGRMSPELAPQKNIVDDFWHVAKSSRNFLDHARWYKTPHENVCWDKPPLSFVDKPVSWVTLGSCLDVIKPGEEFIAKWTGPVRIGFDWNWADQYMATLFPIETMEDKIERMEEIIGRRLLPGDPSLEDGVYKGLIVKHLGREHVEIYGLTGEAMGVGGDMLDTSSLRYRLRLKARETIKHIVKIRLEQLRDLTGLDIRISDGEDAKKANFIIRPSQFYFQLNIFKTPPPGLPKYYPTELTMSFENYLSGAVRMTPYSRAQVDGYFIPDEEGSIQQSVCHIYFVLPDKLMRSLVDECLVRGLGLPNLSSVRPDNLLGAWARTFEPLAAGEAFEKGAEVVGMRRGWWTPFPGDIWGRYNARLDRIRPPKISDYEEKMIRLLYSPAVKAGQSIREPQENKSDILEAIGQIE